MTKAKKPKRQRGYDLATVIDTIEKAVLAAMEIYRAVEPITKVIRRNGRKTK